MVALVYRLGEMRVDGKCNMTSEQLTKLFNDGVITIHELFSRVFEEVTETNVGEFLRAIPLEYSRELDRYLSRLPADDDDEGWSKIVYLCSNLREEEQQEHNKQLRNAVRIVRRYKSITEIVIVEDECFWRVNVVPLPDCEYGRNVELRYGWTAMMNDTTNIAEDAPQGYNRLKMILDDAIELRDRLTAWIEGKEYAKEKNDAPGTNPA